ncbi:hypothetical protein Hanom_Chr02g00109531 [Helianthus anomalus]
MPSRYHPGSSNSNRDLLLHLYFSFWSSPFLHLATCLPQHKHLKKTHSHHDV